MKSLCGLIWIVRFERTDFWGFPFAINHAQSFISTEKQLVDYYDAIINVVTRGRALYQSLQVQWLATRRAQKLRID